ncbi:ribosomal protein S6 kinase-like 1 isoform X1 [Tachysurus fulvidraco]|uniref:ribosomal protein S6 kinase-like 1 isoform X1 n=1 Tax=Tachysurus fulvidraco TaxID=1234273 RepID=UPI001FEFA4E0|nr:ribosomal protein S6 kinase-like 1 isoform X1 [Tachysurus fulvidraco]XP_027028234.2 ribosomal protein S6 kinase-like 1 isoform X1 [Tachysurus fulvidraco]XP_027028235.2 ribosomal protein S6 kinase-like 1 isoform X1 [Tachysurus fulvidraco]XP_047677392.1 ribosomal protein S6 kinase-like 1 isoform X1 [Tachysurus fulvidraco]
MAKRDYLVDAAKQIRMALDREVNEDYEAAFSYYKNGVDLLLNGVQVDPNKERREAVKRKTTQYLKRAEEIFNSHLQYNFRSDTTQLGGYSSLRFRSIRYLSSPVEDLEMCKVVGIIDKVLTVQNLISKETFVIKSLPKSSWENRERSTIIPQGVPFMVKLLRYYVSEDSVFLHLEHVQGGRLFSKLHRIRSELAREHPDCSTPNQHKFQLKNSYTSPALTQLCHLNGEHHQRTSIFPERENVGSLETDSGLTFWNETERQLNNYGTHSYCEETGCLQNSRLEKAEFQQGQSSHPYAIRTDSISSVSTGLQDCLLSQESFPLPVHPCVIVDTRDPLSVTTDLLGNDVHIERIDSSLDFDKVWTTVPAQEQCLIGTRSNPDILGLNSAPQITLNSLFDATQPTLCSTVNILPQKVRIVPNSLPLSSQNQKQNGITHQKTTNSESSQYTVSLSSGNSQPGTEYHNGTGSTVDNGLLRPFTLDFMTTAPQVNNTSKDMERVPVEIGEENWELLSPLCSDKTQDPLFRPHSFQEEQLIEVDGWCQLPQFKARTRIAKQQPVRWGLPEVEVRMWGAQILLALESLHEQGIVCQDLNPRNILLNSSGNVCLTYFGQWTEVQTEVSPKAMDEMYCAPEIGGVSKITEACDWWSLGALLFELLTGMPLWQCHPTGVHPHTQLRIPDHLSTAAASLLTELLQYDAGYRLGSGGGGVSDIKFHPFFNSVPWHTLTS